MNRLSDEELKYTVSMTNRADLKSVMLELLASRRAIVVMREGLENIKSTKKSDLLDAPNYWGNMIVGQANESLSKADKILRGEEKEPDKEPNAHGSWGIGGYSTEGDGNADGYGFYRTPNPNHFYPDYECCTPREIENHKLACKLFDEGKWEEK